MKICAYEVRQDELKDFAVYSKQYDCEIERHEELLTSDTAALAAGCEGVTTLGQSKLDAPLLDKLYAMGVRYIGTRTIGFNHIDVAHAKKIGLSVCHASYDPNGVADFTVMLMLMVLRHYKPSLWRGQVNDWSLQGLQGRELRNLTVGVVGTGRIGAAVIKNLSGFGPKILAYDAHHNPAIESYVEYVPRNTLYENSDIITLHVPLFDSTAHMINSYTIDKMKDGVVLINCARGELMDPVALTKGIESGKIGGLGLDVIEGEEGLVHRDRRTDIISNKDIAYLRQFPNVVMTQHMAFYTDAAVASMVRSAVEGITAMAKNGSYLTML